MTRIALAIWFACSCATVRTRRDTKKMDQLYACNVTMQRGLRECINFIEGDPPMPDPADVTLSPRLRSVPHTHGTTLDLGRLEPCHQDGDLLVCP